MSDLELQQLLGFNDGDLATNRLGRRSASQSKELDESAQSIKKCGKFITHLIRSNFCPVKE